MSPPNAAKSAPLLLVHGDDDYAVRQRARQVFDQWSAEVGGMDHEMIDAQASNSGEALKVIARLRLALQTLPFFGTGKVIWLRDCSFLGDDRTASTEAVGATLTELSQELRQFDWGTVRLLISAGKVDKRKSLFKTIEKIGNEEAHQALSVDDRDWELTAESWVEQALRTRTKSMTPDAMAELLTSVGPNHRQLENEVEKLCLYTAERKQIQVEDVRAVVARSKQARAFALGDALGQRDLPRILRTLDQELWGMKFDSQRSEIGLLYGLITKVRQMIFLKEMLREGWITDSEDPNYARFKTQLQRVPPGNFPQDKRFNPLAAHPYMLFNSLPHARHYTTDELVRAMDLLLRCNQRLVSSNLDEALVLQQTLVQIARTDAEQVGDSK